MIWKLRQVQHFLAKTLLVTAAFFQNFNCAVLSSGDDLIYCIMSLFLDWEGCSLQVAEVAGVLISSGVIEGRYQNALQYCSLLW